MTGPARRALLALVRRLLGGPADELDAAALPAGLVRRHLLAPLAYRAGAVQFKADYIASALQTERRAQALAEAVAALAAVGVTPILLKGIAYAGTLYADPAERPMSDIDLLVPAGAIDQAGAELRRLGYWHAGGEHQRSPRHHALTYKRRDGSIDLHRHISQAGRTRIELEAVWREAVPAHVAGARRPSPDHEYLLHVAHLGRHELSVPLINFVDLARLPPAPPELARRWGLRRSVEAAVAAVAQLRDGTSPPARWSPSTSELLEGGLPPRWLQIIRKISQIDDLSGAAGLLLSTARGRLWVNRRHPAP